MQNVTTDQIQQVINIVVVLTGAVVALGTVGLGAAVIVIRQNKELAHMAWMSIPLPERDSIRTGIVVAKQALDLADEITAPNAGTPASS